MVKMLNKKSVLLIILFSIICLSILLFYTLNRPKTSLTYGGSDKSGFYVLSDFHKVYYISDDNYEVISETDVAGAMYMTAAQNGKVYVPVRGNLSKGGKHIDVFENGVKIKTIKLSYSLPEFAKYNPYNDKIYVNHICKITNQSENCITVLNTSKDEEEKNIMYNYSVFDIAFTSDNIMLVSSSDIIKPDWKVDVIDLKNDSKIKTIPVDVKITSMVALPDSSLLFGVSEMMQEPFIFVFDWEKGVALEKIPLEYEYPSRINLEKIDGKYRIYAAHRNIDDNSGENISIVDPYERKVIDEITHVKCPTDISFEKENIMVANWKDSLVYVINNKEVRKTININKPTAIVVVKE